MFQQGIEGAGLVRAWLPPQDMCWRVVLPQPQAAEVVKGPVAVAQSADLVRTARCVNRSYVWEDWVQYEYGNPECLGEEGGGSSLQ